MKPNTADIQQRYNRIAPYFESLEAVMEGLIFKSWREKCWAEAQGHHILEVGVGTGKNFD
jgi:ubiquinone/menaquinone biosynthesis C-methylase UbiE